MTASHTTEDIEAPLALGPWYFISFACSTIGGGSGYGHVTLQMTNPVTAANVDHAVRMFETEIKTQNININTATVLHFQELQSLVEVDTAKMTEDVIKAALMQEDAMVDYDEAAGCVRRALNAVGLLK